MLMSKNPPGREPVETLLQYLELDSVRREPLFDGFITAVKSIARNGDQAMAAEFARRAVTNRLDYSSLRKLGRIIRSNPDGASELRIALLGGSTTSQLAELLAVFLSAANLDVAVFCGEYRQFRMELRGSSASLNDFSPNLIVLALDALDSLAPFNLGWDQNELHSAAEQEAEALANLWHSAQERWGCCIVQNVLDSEPFPVLGNYAFTHGVSRDRYAAAISAAMAGRAKDRDIHFHDIPSLVREVGSGSWYDPRYYNEAKLPCSPECLPLYAHSLASMILGIRGKGKKMLVLDLDNTLWGGVVGELGPWDIEIGEGSGQAEAFLRFQRYVKELAVSGVVLGICSKNDHANAMAPFESNPNMILRPDDIASFKANWRSKDENIREMAREVSLGLEALVFVDDNPMERALVRRLLPEVAVPDMPEDPSFYIGALAEGRYFERAALTAEDFARSSHYTANRRRREMIEVAGDLDSFLLSLEMVATFEALNDSNIERAVQLINKSNQFNLTGVKRDRNEVRQLMGCDDWITFAVTLKDKCGDSGLISVLLLQKDGDALVVDSWVMSCRVLQRGLENRILQELLAVAERNGCGRIEGKFRKTLKNGMVEKLYQTLGFMLKDESDGVQTWLAATDSSTLAACSHIQ